MKNDDELVSANSKLGLLSGVVGFAAAVPAGLLQLVDSRATLVMSAAMFASAGFASLRLPRHVATAPNQAEKIEIEEMRGLQVRRIAISMMLLRG
ncbi:MAG: hypothetical protein ACKOGL_05535, partial [Acidimicrobiaceae bacterium]